MPMHDWERVEAGIFHAFHHWWISEISDALNRGLLPKSLYALPEQVAAGFGPDVLTLHDDTESTDASGGTATLTQAKPKASHTARLVGGVTPRRKSLIAVRHVTGDRVVAIIEIVSPGNKNTGHAFRSFIQKATELLEQRVHWLSIDPFPPITCELHDVNAYIETIAVGDPLPDMPLFVAPNGHILVPLEKTYQAAWDKVPARWQHVIAPPTS